MEVRFSSPGPPTLDRAGRGAYAVRALPDLCLGNAGVWKEKAPPKRGQRVLGTLRKEGLGFSASRRTPRAGIGSTKKKPRRATGLANC
jgi:hypothetical protein